MAEQYITDYYHRYEPFDRGKTISIEDRIVIDLDGTGAYKLQGFIDRLVEVDDGMYEVHDYKTNSRLPLPEYIENDRQLALYAIGVKERYPDCKDVRLVWHFLKFDKEIDSTRTEAELEQLKKDTVALIETIENTDQFPCQPSALCDWCEFKPLCKQWAHLYKLKEKPENEYLNDSGVKLVNRYAELKKKKNQINHELSSELEQVEEALAHFAETEGVDVVFGSDKRVRIKEHDRFSFPSKRSKKRKQLVDVIKTEGKWDEVNQLDTSALNTILVEKEWDEQLRSKIMEYATLKSSKRFYLGSIKK
ncbi:MAG: hypothetical protein BAJALOKI1v1_2620003 [Promethearchaeota archaeon]|nr:MAG: hypothetical protein BAJALOKI1v1_2620003 [Candidatus Lokiarchaeota archaeon]